MKLKRLTAMLLATVMAFGAVNVAFAEEKAEDTKVEAMYKSSTDITYAVDGGNIYFRESIGKITGADEEITSAVIPDTINEVAVTGIDNFAFSGCRNLESIILPDSIKSIGKAAFVNCENLQNIYISENNDYFTIDDGILFSKDKKTIYAYPPKKSGTSYTIPDTVTTIRYCQDSAKHFL